jgi:ribosomal protein S30
MALSQAERNTLWRLRHPDRYQAKQRRDYAQRRRERAAYELLLEVEATLEAVLLGEATRREVAALSERITAALESGPA